MAPYKSLDDIRVISALLRDIVSTENWFDASARVMTLQAFESRLRTEGMGFLTKTLPSLGKALDRALSGEDKLNAESMRFRALPNSTLPQFCGELFVHVLNRDGSALPEPCSKRIRALRQLCYVLYKYELPYSDEQEHEVVSSFEKTEEDLIFSDRELAAVRHWLNENLGSKWKGLPNHAGVIARKARRLLWDVLGSLDPQNIVPRHGPGSVATGQRLWEKYRFTNVAAKLRRIWPLSEFFFAGHWHCFARAREYDSMADECKPARVILVPKDSRGPRLISCEPVDFQWIQGGLRVAITDLVEKHDNPARGHVWFTNQQHNRDAAQTGSVAGGLVTIDLKEASDRVSLELVRLLFPGHVYEALEACRSESTVLPDGREIRLRKFAPMGSSLCFPIMALSIWSLLAAAAPDQDALESILVYGDDVIVTAQFADYAMSVLEGFGLKVNRSKSCTKGRFRESCGMDAFAGVDVTPVRFRTVWSESPSPDVYTSWIAYANSCYDRQYFQTYEEICKMLFRVYGEIACDDMFEVLGTCPSLRQVPQEWRPKRRRFKQRNPLKPDFQKVQYFVRDVKARSVYFDGDGYLSMLRYFTKRGDSRPNEADPEACRYDRLPPTMWAEGFNPAAPHSVSSYTQRRTTKFVRCWR